MATVTHIIDKNLPVYATGNQIISGVKNFASRPTVNGIGVSLSGEAANFPEIIVYTTGAQVIGGQKSFIDDINISGSTNQYITFGKPNNLDFRTRIVTFTGDYGLTFMGRGGSSPVQHGYGIVFDGGGLSKKGYFTAGTSAYPTGYQFATLDWVNRILSGTWRADQINIKNANPVLTQTDQTISGIKTFASRPTVNGTGVLLSGEATVLPTTIVYTTGNQNISGVKTFLNQIQFHLPGNLTGPYTPTISGSTIYETLTRLDITSYQTKLKSLAGDSITIGDEEGRLDINTVADTSTFNLGYGHNASSILFYNITSPSINLYGQVNGQTGTFQKLYADNLIYNTGNQTISGVKTFASRPTVNGTGVLLVGEGVASPVNISDEGINQGSASRLNFVGAGISASVGGSIATITVNGGGGGISFVSPPPTPRSAGTSGQMALDQNYSYFCISNNNWRRSAISSW